MCYIFCADQPCLCTISLEFLSFLKSNYSLQLTHVQNSKHTTCYSFCKSMSPFEQFQHHHTSGTCVPLAPKKIILPHAHVLQEYLETPNMLKTLTFVKVPYVYTIHPSQGVQLNDLIQRSHVSNFSIFAIWGAKPGPAELDPCLGEPMNLPESTPSFSTAMPIQAQSTCKVLSDFLDFLEDSPKNKAHIV